MVRRAAATEEALVEGMVSKRSPNSAAAPDSHPPSFLCSKFYEESEDGFNSSPLDAAGRIAEHWYNQDELRWVLYAWARS